MAAKQVDTQTILTHFSLPHTVIIPAIYEPVSILNPLSPNAELENLGTWNFDNNAILTQFSQQSSTNNHYSPYH